MFAPASMSTRSAPTAALARGEQHGGHAAERKLDVEARGRQPLRQIVARGLRVQLGARGDQRARDHRSRSCAAAYISGVCPCQRSTTLTFAPRSIRSCTAASAARARGEHQRRLTLWQRALDFGARVEQRSDQRGIGNVARLV